jgi:DNA repair protein RadC
MSMNNDSGLGNGGSEQNIFPDTLAEPEGELLRAVFRGAPFLSRLARAPGGWRTLSKCELDALKLTPEDQEAVCALQTLVQRSYPVLPKHKIIDSGVVASIYGHRLGGLMHEVMIALALDGKNHFLAEVEVGRGGTHRLAVAPRDVIRPLLRTGASTFILLHNHPSGDPTPSPEDLKMTRTMVDCANTVGLPMVDHVIIGGQGGGYRSLLDLGVIEPAA